MLLPKLSDTPSADYADRWVRKVKGEQYEYSDTNNILYVVYGNRRSPAGPLDHNLYIGPGFCVPYAKHVVSHSARNLQRGLLLVPRVVQNLLYCLQCRSLRGVADHRLSGFQRRSSLMGNYSL